MRSTLSKTFALVAAVALLVHAQPEVSFSGFLDADAWTDFEGNFYTNHELDVGMGVNFTDKVSANVYVTMTNGDIPAQFGSPSDRWGEVAFDGFDITFETSLGKFSVGDLVYQFGGFNYYLYKRLSMITPENFTRGIQYTVGTETFTQSLITGVADEDMSTADIFGVTEIGFGEGLGLSLFYGLRSSVLEGFEAKGRVFAGAEFLGTFAEVLEIKADVGYRYLEAQTIEGDEGPEVVDIEAASVVSLLLEPTLTLGSFSTALSFYYFIDPEETGANFVYDEMYIYIEPGYSFNDYFAAGLPLEIHTGDLDEFEATSAFWAVPTAYIYPFDNVEWWIWGGMSVPLGEEDLAGDETEVAFSLGSEIIVEF